MKPAFSFRVVHRESSITLNVVWVTIYLISIFHFEDISQILENNVQYYILNVYICMYNVQWVGGVFEIS
jgi:hypothetical protein